MEWCTGTHTVECCTGTRSGVQGHTQWSGVRVCNWQLRMAFVKYSRDPPMLPVKPALSMSRYTGSNIQYGLAVCK